MVLCAAGLLALVPFVAGPFLRISVEALDRVEAGAFVGSLFGVLVLVAVPVMLLGAVAPYAVRLSVRTVEEAGRVAGRLYAISTIGSLVGTFLERAAADPARGHAAHVPGLRAGPRACRGPGAPAALRRWRRVGVALLLAIPVGTVKATGDARVIWDRETEYQYARVTERPDGERRLELNEGQAVHSVYRPGEWLTGDYWDEMLVLPFATTGRAPRSVAILGNAAGTTARAYGHYFPAARVDGVEIDPALTDVGRRLFDLRGPNLHLHTADARPFLRRATRRWDVIVVDAYRQPYIPFYLSTREFFAEVARPPRARRRGARQRRPPARLRSPREGAERDDGPRRSRPCGATRSRRPTRCCSAATRRRRRARWTPRRARCRPTCGGRRPGRRAAWRRRCAAGAVYTDDRAPVEWLIDASIVQVAADGDR